MSTGTAAHSRLLLHHAHVNRAIVHSALRMLFATQPISHRLLSSRVSSEVLIPFIPLPPRSRLEASDQRPSAAKVRFSEQSDKAKQAAEFRLFPLFAPRARNGGRQSSALPEKETAGTDTVSEHTRWPLSSTGLRGRQIYFYSTWYGRSIVTHGSGTDSCSDSTERQSVQGALQLCNLVGV